MSKKSPKPVADLFSTTTALGQSWVLKRALQLATLEARLLPTLPAQLRDHCRIANIRDGVLVLQTDSPTWATKAKFAVADLVSQAKAQGLPVQRVRVTVRTGDSPPKHAPRRAAMPKSAAAMLDDLANTVTNPGLAASLRRLAKNGKSR